MAESGQIIAGFTIKDKQWVEEIGAHVLLGEHIGTGAQLAVVECDDDNKVFMATFRTPVSDHTGVPHIIEHSVLNGSRKYPVKEPFLELLKGSLYTFLNAFTYPDKTCYPVASRNAEDFQNLMDVYLDAVFHPLLSENTFLQEGWHYDLEETDGPLTYSGVVYNEMKGVFSDPESMLSEEMDRVLFPDSNYGLSSGGNPDHIPELTYEGFCKFHRDFYHPSNARLYLYGDIDVEERLTHLDNYLQHFKRCEVKSDIRKQPRLDMPTTHVCRYPVTPGSDVARKTYALKCWMLEDSTDPVYYLSMNVLAHILCGTQASPLRKALIDSKLGEDCLADGFEEDILQTYFGIGLKGTDADSVPDMERVINETLEKLVRDGLEPRVIEASLNTIEFSLREANFGSYPKGLIFGLIMLNSWIYDADPLMHLRYEPTLAAIKEGIARGNYFEGLIQKHLLDNQHQVTLTMVPDEQMEEREREDQQTHLATLKAAMPPEDIQAILKQCDDLEEAQLEPDTPEALATLPKLKVSSIDRQAEDYPLVIVQEGDETSPKVTWSEQPTNGIAYLKLLFDASGVEQDLFMYLPLFASALIQSGTESRDFVEITQEIGIQTGGLHAGYGCGGVWGDRNAVRSNLALTSKVLHDKIPALFDLLVDILHTPDFANHTRLEELSRIGRSRLRSSIVPHGNGYVNYRLDAYRSSLGLYNEYSRGISQYHFIETLIEEIAQHPTEVEGKLRVLLSRIMSAGNLHLHITGSEEDLKAILTQMPRLLQILPTGRSQAASLSFAPLTPGEGLIVPSQIQYVGKGINLYDHGFTYDGSFEVLKRVLSRDYLWNTVRVQGNAYGCFASLDAISGQFACISYRDPNLRKTLETYDAFAAFLSKLELNQDELDKLIIGTMGRLDSPKTPDQKGAAALSRYLTGTTLEMVQSWREQTLDTTLAKLKSYGPCFEQFRDVGDVCVMGSEERINGDKDCFQTTLNVFSS